MVNPMCVDLEIITKVSNLKIGFKRILDNFGQVRFFSKLQPTKENHRLNRACC